MKKFFSLIAAVLFAGSMMATTVTKTVAELAVEKSFTNSAVCTPFDLDEVISVSTSASDANTGKYYSNGEQIRLYQTGAASITLTAAEGYKISSVTLTYASQNTGILVEAESGVAVDFENVQSATFTVGNSGTATNGQARITAFSVTYDADGEAPAVATPVISGEAEFAESTQVSISCETASAAIYYSLNGADPTTNSLPYDEPFTLTETATVKAVAYDIENNAYSAVASKTFTKVEPAQAITCLAVYQLAKNDVVDLLNDVVVTYANGKNVWVKDETASMLIYLSANATWQAGDVLSGVAGVVDVYNGIHEIKPTAAQAAAVVATPGEVPAAEEVASVAASDVNKYIVMKNVEAEGAFTEGSQSNITINGVAVRNQFKNGYTFESGKHYDIYGVVTLYQSNPQVYFISAEEVGGEVPPTPADTYTVAGAPASIFGEEWNPALAANDMTLANGIYKWEKAELDLTAGDIEFKVVKNHSWDNPAYPAQNYVLNIAEDGEYTITITFDPATEAVAAEAVKNEPLADPTNCAEAAAAALSVSANNELYNNGAVYTIEGYVTGIKTAYSDQYHNISFWMADAADGGEVLQAYRAACASEADAPKVGDKVQVTGSLTKYGTTPEFAAGCTYVITEPYIPVEPTINYYVIGSMTEWNVEANYKLVANPAVEGEYMGEFTFANNDEFKIAGDDGSQLIWYPDGMGNNFQITEAGDYEITFNPAGNVDGWYAGFFNVVKKEAPIVPQYEVAEAIAAGLQENDEVLVRGIITKMEFKGANFAKYGSVNIYVADATDAEGEFEFFNCYSLNADTFRTSIPNYDPTDKSWAQFNEVADENGNTIHVGDTVIAFGKYKLYNSTHELNTGCYLVDIKHAPQVPADTIKLDFNTENTTYAFVDNQYFSEYGTTDIYLSDINVNASTYEFEGDGNYLVLDFYPENPNNVTGVYQALDETLDLEYTYMLTINGTDTTVVEFADGAIQVEIGEVNKELGMAQLALAGQLISTEGDIYAITALVIAYYDFLPEEGVEDVVIDPKAIKSIVNGQVVIEKAGKTYNMNGAVIR